MSHTNFVAQSPSRSAPDPTTAENPQNRRNSIRRWFSQVTKVTSEDLPLMNASALLHCKTNVNVHFTDASKC